MADGFTGKAPENTVSAPTGHARENQPAVVTPGTPTPREPQCPGRSISKETADSCSSIGRNDVPYNKGGEGHGLATG